MKIKQFIKNLCIFKHIKRLKYPGSSLELKIPRVLLEMAPKHGNYVLRVTLGTLSILINVGGIQKKSAKIP